MNWNNLKAGITAVVKENNNQEITGSNLQNVLITMVNSLGANATYGGIAHPNTSPGTPDGPVFWFASEPGVYSNFGNTEIDNAGIFTWDGVSWSFEKFDFDSNYLQLVDEDGFFYVDAAGNIAFRYTPVDGLDAAKVSRHLSDLIMLRLVTDEDGFYYTDAAGNIVMKYTPADGFDVAKVSSHFKSLLPSSGGDYSDLTETIYNI